MPTMTNLGYIYIAIGAALFASVLVAWLWGRRKRKRVPSSLSPDAGVAVNSVPEWWCGPCEQERSEDEVYQGGCHGPRCRHCHGPCEVHWVARRPRGG